MKYRLGHIVQIILVIYLVVLEGCAPNKYVPEGQYLLDNNHLIQTEKVLSDSELRKIIKQKPNRRILNFRLKEPKLLVDQTQSSFWRSFKFRIYLGLYNLSNQKRIDRLKARRYPPIEARNYEIDSINAARRAASIDGKYQHLSHQKYPFIFGLWLREVGEAPVILDSTLTERSSKQLKTYLFTKGFFDAKISDNVVVTGKRRCEVNYSIDPGPRYTIRNLQYAVKDTFIQAHINRTLSNAKITAGEAFDIDKLSAERIRVAKLLQNNGYYFFNEQHIHYQVDSSISGDFVDVYFKVQNKKQRDILSDSVVEKPHKAYNISAIKIDVNFDPSSSSAENNDTVYHDGVEIHFNNIKGLKFSRQLLTDALFIKSGDVYSKEKQLKTLKRYTSLDVFNFVNINFEEDPNQRNCLICRIKLDPSKPQSFSLETDGTHTDGVYGLSGSAGYQHKNILKNAEHLRITFTGGLEAQQVLTDTAKNTLGSQGGVGNQLQNVASVFNTIEIGPEITLTVPKFIGFRKLSKRLISSRTQFKTALNYQNREDYERTLAQFQFGYIWHPRAPLHYQFSLESSVIDITPKSQAFKEKIETLSDPLLAYSYRDHIIPAARIGFTYNGQANTKSTYGDFAYLHTAVEVAGNMARGIYSLVGAKSDADGSYKMFNINFAQYAKAEADLRLYHIINERHSSVFRIMGGIGKPLANLRQALPFEKSFYGGGTSGVRSWRARTLGPGSFRDSSRVFDKIGDIKLEANIEYRFDLVGMVEAALFLDAGNIWLSQKNDNRPNGHFEWSDFYNEFAIGAGIGFRLDFDFFLIRLDFGKPLKNPALELGERWIWSKGLSRDNRRNEYRIQWNLGIGYPF